MTMFWKKVKSDDQYRVCINIKIAQPIPARIDITNGMNGLGSFALMATILSLEFLNVCDCCPTAT